MWLNADATRKMQQENMSIMAVIVSWVANPEKNNAMITPRSAVPIDAMALSTQASFDVMKDFDIVVPLNSFRIIRVSATERIMLVHISTVNIFLEKI